MRFYKKPLLHCHGESYMEWIHIGSRGDTGRGALDCDSP